MIKSIFKNNIKEHKLTTFGFTLIELLAVIVILAIIALIATPVILGIINNVKDEANKRSIEMYAKAIENAVAKYQLTGKKLELTSLKVIEESNGRKFENSDFEVDYDGNVICDVIEVYEYGSMYLANCTVNGQEVDYTYGKDQSYNNGQEVYFDISKGIGCTKNEYESSWDETTQDYLNSKTGYNGVNGTGSQNSCLKFYAFNDDYGEKINLILDHNTTDLVAWNSSNSNTSGPAEVINQLKTDTNEWVGTITPANYEYKGTERPYTINYSEYKARLITAQEIAKITGADLLLSWDETSTTSDGDGYYLDGAKTNDTVPNWQTRVVGSDKEIKVSDYYWLFDRTKDCTSYGCQVADGSTYGYWTSSAHAGYSVYIWYVHDFGSLISFYRIASDVGYCGVRPVIEVLKSNL